MNIPIIIPTCRALTSVPSVPMLKMAPTACHTALMVCREREASWSGNTPTEWASASPATRTAARGEAHAAESPLRVSAEQLMLNRASNTGFKMFCVCVSAGVLVLDCLDAMGKNISLVVS